MAELTKERLEEIHAEYSKPNHSKSFSVKDSEIAEMARRLLAGLEQEPYGYVHKEVYEAEGSCGLSSDHEAHRDSLTHIPLYAAPQLPQPAVTDELLDEIDNLLTACRVYACRSRRGGSERDIPRTENAQEKLRACRAAMLHGAEPVSQPYKLPDDTRRLDWLDAQNKRLNDYYGTAYGWKFDANFQRNAMMLNDSNYPVMTVRQAIDEAMAAAPQQEVK